jgi:hypothetical protein
MWCRRRARFDPELRASESPTGTASIEKGGGFERAQLTDRHSSEGINADHIDGDGRAVVIHSLFRFTGPVFDSETILCQAVPQ